MKIQIRINSSNHSVSTDQLTDVELAVIQQPDERVIFELVDIETGLGPQNIVVKRLGTNLEIAPDDAENAMIVIEDYYRNAELSPIVGLAEDDRYYTYLPESGLPTDSIAELKDNVLSAEVLGGDVPSTTPFFASWQWVVGGFAAAILDSAFSKRHYYNNSSEETISAPIFQNESNGNIKIVLPTKTSPGHNLTVKIVHQNNQTTEVMLVKQFDGTWSSNHPEIIPSTTSANKNSTILLAEHLNAKTVTAQFQDSSGAFGDEITLVSNNMASFRTAAQTQPSLPENAIVPEKNAQLEEVSYIKPNGAKETINLAKDLNTNQWSFDGHSPDGVVLDPKTGYLTISPQNIKQATSVSVTTIDNTGHLTVSTFEPAIRQWDNVVEQVNQSLQISADNFSTSEMIYTQIDGEQAVISLAKKPNADEWFTADRLPSGVELDKTGKLTFDSLNTDDDLVVVNYGKDSSVSILDLSQHKLYTDQGDDRLYIQGNIKQYNEISMYDGHDIFVSKAEINSPLNLDMGTGNDIALLSNYTASAGKFNGGEGYDTLILGQGAEFNAHSGVIGWERADLHAEGANTFKFDTAIDQFLLHNHSDIVADDGNTYQNVFIVSGDQQDSISQSSLREVAYTTVEYEGDKYHSYHLNTGSLWIEQDIQIL